MALLVLGQLSRANKYLFKYLDNYKWILKRAEIDIIIRIYAREEFFFVKSFLIQPEVCIYLPLRLSIRRVPSSVHHVSPSSLCRTRGLYSQPELRSGIHLRFPAFSDGLRNQPYWCPTTVPTNQLLDVALKKNNLNFRD